MNKSTSNHNKPWTPADRAELARLARGDTPSGVIGLKLKRTPVAIQSQASRLGVSLMPPNRSPYNRSKPPKGGGGGR
jgi:hypothetical protein